MPYIAQAILVVLLAIAGFAGAIWMHLRNRRRISLAVLLLTALFLRLFSASSHYLHPWDERYHALVAKHLIEHPLVPTLYDRAILPYDPANWEANHIWLHKPPLSLWLIALTLKLFGISAFAVRVPSILLSTLGIAITYAIARRLFDNRIAFFAALFHALCGILMAQSSGWFSTDHPDTIFIFFIELGVYFSVLQREKLRWRYAIFAGIAMGFAFLTKWAAAFVILPVWLGLMWDRRPLWKTATAGLIMLVIAVAMAAPWQIYTSRAFPTEFQIESSYNWKHLSTAVEDHDNGVFYHLLKAYDFYGVLVYPAIISAIVLFFKKRLPSGAGPLLVWFGLTYAVFTFAATKMGGYVLIAAPAVFILMALVVAFLQDAAARREGGRPWADAIFVAFAITAGVPIVQRLNLFNHIPPEPAWAAVLRNIERQLPNTPTVIFNDPHPIETMFDTNAIAYDTLPSADDLHIVSAAGYAIVIIHGEGETPAIIRPDNVRILEAPAALWEDSRTGPNYRTPGE